MTTSRVSPAIVAGGATEYAVEDAMELRVAAEAGFEQGAGLAVSIDIEEALDALPVAEVDEGETRLLMEEPAEAARAESGVTGQLSEGAGRGVVPDETGGALDGGMHVLHGDFAGVLKALPCEEQRVGDACIEEGLMPGRGEIGEECSKTLHVLLREPSAGFKVAVGLKQGTRRYVDRDAADHAPEKDADPHAEVGGLLDEDVFLRGEEPEEIAAADFVAAIAEKIDAATVGDEIQFQFGIGVKAVGGGKVVVLPDAAIKPGLQMQMLTHDKKR